MIADMIEAEQTVDVSALNLLCEKLEVGGEKSRDIAAQIRAALNGAERTKTEHGGVDVDALLKLADHFERIGNGVMVARFVEPAEYHKWKARIRDAVKGANASKSMPLPEGIEWPTYEDGELVEFGGVAKVREDIGEVIEVRFHTGKCSEVTIAFEGESTATHYMVVDGPHLKRPEPEVLDADGVPIKVGDTVWNVESGKRYEVLKLPAKNSYQSIAVRGEDGTDGFDPTCLTHRKPDTQESIDADAMFLVSESFFDQRRDEFKDRVFDLLARQRKLLGAEQ